MNFLLHRRLALSDLGSEEAAAGAMLPDLWRMADRRVRARKGLPTEAQLEAGIAHHLQLDDSFHRSELFLQGETRLLRRIRQVRFKAPKMLLLAHPAWEMCLDGALLRREGLAPTLDALDRAQAWLGGAPSLQAADRHHFDRVPRRPGQRQVFAQRLARLAHDLVHSDWLEGYQQGPSLALRVEGLRRRVGLGRLDPDERDSLARILDRALEEADAELPDLLR